MNSATKVLGLAFLLLAAIGGGILVQTAVNYVWVTEAQSAIQGNIHVAAVLVFPAGPNRTTAYAEVVFNVTNVGQVSIAIITFEFDLYMGNGSRGLTQDERVGTGSFSRDRLSAVATPPGATTQLALRVNVRPNTPEFTAFHVPDAEGRYHPVISSARVVVSFPEFDVFRPFTWANRGAYGSPSQPGVLPAG